MGIIFSTDKNFNFEDQSSEDDTLPNERQILKLRTEKKGRAGKIVTIVAGFVGKKDDLKVLEKNIKNFCATGGNIKDDEIIVQGDLRDKIKAFLIKERFKVKG